MNLCLMDAAGGNPAGPLQSLKVSTKCGNIIFVKSNATGANNGTSWADAYTDLHTAITNAQDFDQVWVAAGTYMPMGNGTGKDRHFKMKNKLSIYGGFAGTEDPYIFNIFDRNFVANACTLSGQGQRYHVIANLALDTTAILDGFTITGGTAYTPDPVDCAPNNCIGGGMLNLNSNPKIRNCTFFYNSAYDMGGGMANISSKPLITNCIFNGNMAANGGGVGFIDECQPVITNCTFTNNTATEAGGGIYIDSQTNDVKIRNSIIWNNAVMIPCQTEPEEIFCGHQIFNQSNLMLDHCCYSNIQNHDIYPPGAFNHIQSQTTDPLFIHPFSNLRLQDASPAINTGSNSFLLPDFQKDLDGNPRVIGNPDKIVDMGAYEMLRAGDVTCPQNIDATSIESLKDNPIIYLTGRTPDVFPYGGTFASVGTGVVGNSFRPVDANTDPTVITYTYTNPTVATMSQTCTFTIDLHDLSDNNRDFGDAPAPYPTMLPNGARHTWDLWPYLFLGDNADIEANGQPTPGSTGDDLIPLTGPNDEDGIGNLMPLTLIPGTTPTLNIKVKQCWQDNFSNWHLDDGSYILNAWIDFANNGNWTNPEDHIIKNCIPQPGVTHNTTGDNDIKINVPVGAIPGNAYARFRFSHWPAGVDNLARCGEVEDYRVTITLPLSCPDDLKKCIEDPQFILSGATPTGGIYSGNGVIYLSGDPFFDPATAGLGTHLITYTFGSPPNAFPCNFNISVFPQPEVTCGENMQMCYNSLPVTLAGGLPEGGIYSGIGVANGQFDPGISGSGIFTITYTFTDENECDGSCTFTVTVFAEPEITCPAMVPLCANDPVFPLNIATPSGGTYTCTSNGQVMTEIDPVVMGPGTFHFLYEYTDPVNGCVGNAYFLVVISEPPLVYCPNEDDKIADLCENSPPYELPQGNPPGGIFNGPGVINGIFDAGLTGSGIFQISYSITDVNGCSASCSFEITVNEVPTVSAGPDVEITLGSNTLLDGSLTGGTPPYTYLWSPANGLSDPSIPNPVASPGETTTYTLLVTDANGCAGTDEVTITVLPGGGGSVAGILHYNNQLFTPLQGVEVDAYMGNVLMGSAQSSATGDFQFSNLPPGDYELDFSYAAPWGGVNATDAMRTLQHFVEINPLAGLFLAVADVNSNQYVNSGDALDIARRYVGLINSFSLGDWVFENITFPLVLNASLNFMVFGLCGGDVNGSYTPVPRLEPSLTLSGSGTCVPATGDIVDIPLTIGEPAGINALSVILHVNDDWLDIQDVSMPGNPGNLVWNMIGKELRIAWYSLETRQMQAGEAVFTLTMKVKRNRIPEKGCELLTVMSLDGSSNMADASSGIVEAVLLLPAITTVTDPLQLSIHPNPFKEETTISYYLPQEGVVHIALYDMVGKRMSVPLTMEIKEQGFHSMTVSSAGTGNGVFLCRLRYSSDNQVAEVVKKVVVLK
ncbi:MAG TPA: right-handed parallel beta-helix repeat-containing protein [Bacteroidales bacterium]|nr:right-handed parallel beta-helix repeat-containing protein [Bacteroidales bacterium]HSA43878.1 right-handed parallel beta-helix repeat-containing protein [Bacteroidales bacterium]